MLLARFAYPALADDEEGIADSALSDDVLALLVAVLLKNIGDLDQSLLRKVHEGGDGFQECRVLGLFDQTSSHHDGLEALSLYGP